MVFSQNRHKDVLDLCVVQFEPDSKDYIKVSSLKCFFFLFEFTPIIWANSLLVWYKKILNKYSFCGHFNETMVKNMFWHIKVRNKIAVKLHFFFWVKLNVFCVFKELKFHSGSAHFKYIACFYCYLMLQDCKYLQEPASV